MARLHDILDVNFKDDFDTLKNTSYDKENNLYMCQSQMKVVDFDNLTNNMYPQKQPSSYDALWTDEDLKNIYCVEFKNQNKSSVKNQNIQKKAKDGKETLKNICNKYAIAIDDYTIVYCVVHKSNPNKREYRTRYDDSSVHYGLQKYIGVYFDEVRTNNIDYFTNQFSKKYSCV